MRWLQVIFGHGKMEVQNWKQRLTSPILILKLLEITLPKLHLRHEFTIHSKICEFKYCIQRISRVWFTSRNSNYAKPIRSNRFEHDGRTTWALDCHHQLDLEAVCPLDSTSSYPRLTLYPSGWTWTLEKEINVIIDSKGGDQFSNLFLNWYKKHARFILRTCSSMVIDVRARGHCESSCRSARE